MQRAAAANAAAAVRSDLETYFAMLPSGDLTLGSDGNFYGVVFQGGVNGGGAIFSMAVDGTTSGGPSQFGA
jgi:hypothetical protein